MSFSENLAKAKHIEILVYADLNLTDEERVAAMKLIERDLRNLINKATAELEHMDRYTPEPLLTNVGWEMGLDSEGKYVWVRSPERVCETYGHLWSDSMPQFCERCGVYKGDVV